jgi:hypothetical protein
MTTLPHLGTHFRFHEFLIDLIFGEVPDAPESDSAAGPPQPPPDRVDFGQFHPPLKLFPDDPGFAVYDPTKLTGQFRTLFSRYASLLPQERDITTFELTPTREMVIPPRTEAVPDLARCGFDLLFSRLGCEHVVRVIRSILLEQKVLFVSADVGIASLCTLAALPLALPMTFKTALLPFLPDDDDFLAFLDSPVPYCFGVLHSARLARCQIGPDVTVVDLDLGKVTYPEDIPHLPRARELRAEINSLINELLRGMALELPKQPDALEEFWSKRECPEIKKRLKLRFPFDPGDATRILDTVTRFVTEFVKEETLCGCRVRDTTDPANPKVGFIKEVYLIGATPSEADFFEQFVQTQTFVAHFEKSAVYGAN